jgi:hypothetical protein
VQNGRLTADTTVCIHDVTMIEVVERLYVEDKEDSWKCMVVRFTHKDGQTVDVECFTKDLNLCISDIVTQVRG